MTVGLRRSIAAGGRRAATVRAGALVRAGWFGATLSVGVASIKCIRTAPEVVAASRPRRGRVGADAGWPFTLSTPDTGSPTQPADLVAGDPSRPGSPLSDAVVRERFATFPGWPVPRLVDRNVWALSLADEGETLIEDEAVSSERLELQRRFAVARVEERVRP